MQGSSNPAQSASELTATTATEHGQVATLGHCATQQAAIEGNAAVFGCDVAPDTGVGVEGERVLVPVRAEAVGGKEQAARPGVEAPHTAVPGSGHTVDTT